MLLVIALFRSKRRSLSLTTALAMALAIPVAAHASAPGAVAVGDVEIGSPIAQTVYLALRNESGAEAYARAVQTPGPQFHHFLSRDAFVKRFAPTDADIAKVESALTQLGYTIGTVFPNHLAIQVTSSAGTAEAALGVKLKRMTLDGHTGMVPTGTPTVPASIRSLVRGIGGLNTLHRSHPMRTHSAVAGRSASTPLAAGTTLTGGTPGFYLPQDFATRYNVDPIYANGFKGRGTTIGIVTLANFYPADAYQFWKAIGLNVDQNRITTVSVDGGTDIAPSDQLGEGESDLDVQESGGIAPDARLRVYVSQNNNAANFIDGVEAAASENIADTVSISWGQPELNFFAEPSQNIAADTYLLDAFHDAFLEMGIQGQSVYVASGDSGSYDTVRSCPNSGTPSVKKPVCNAPYSVDMPANDPAVTAAGGTTTPVSETLRAGGVISVKQEQAWSWNWIYTQAAELGHPIALSRLFAEGGGGGVSAYFKKPYYQVGVAGMTRTKADQYLTQDVGNGPVELLTLPANFAGRNMPDISANADPDSGYQYIEEGNVLTYWGGTSFVAPLLNGVTALAVQGTGGRVGLMNNIAYGLGSAATDDITGGDNWGYTGKTGYDNAAGLGVLNATKLANALLTLKSLYGH